ncbi:MAG: OmpA family protein [Chitinophagaceae bacterium]|nr:OmpA family protein [Chitinophagaceae bacterium]
MKLKYFLLLALAPAFLFSCVSSKKFKAAQAQLDSLNQAHSKLQGDFKLCEDGKAENARKNAAYESEIADLKKQLAFVKENNTTALKQLEDLSVISAAQAESIKKSLDNIGAKDAYIQDLQASLARKDSLNMALVMNLKGAIGNLDDQDINIKVDKGVVFIDISDKLLFRSGSYDITEKAKEVLGKVAQVLKNQSDVEFMVEGHTDDISYSKGVLLDNWDLSVKRSTAVVRVLQKQYGLSPAKIIAAGRGEYVPVADNNTAQGRAANRRTRIVILPQLDQFFKLLEPKQ